MSNSQSNTPNVPGAVSSWTPSVPPRDVHELEDTLRQHPEVADVAAIVVPTDVWGDVLVAYVVVHDSSTKLLPSEIKAWCDARTGNRLLLASVRFILELPRGWRGMVDKHHLRHLYSESPL